MNSTTYKVDGQGPKPSGSTAFPKRVAGPKRADVSKLKDYTPNFSIISSNVQQSTCDSLPSLAGNWPYGQLARFGARSVPDLSTHMHVDHIKYDQRLEKSKAFELVCELFGLGPLSVSQRTRSCDAVIIDDVPDLTLNSGHDDFIKSGGESNPGPISKRRPSSENKKSTRSGYQRRAANFSNKKAKRYNETMVKNDDLFTPDQIVPNDILVTPTNSKIPRVGVDNIPRHLRNFPLADRCEVCIPGRDNYCARCKQYIPVSDECLPPLAFREPISDSECDSGADTVLDLISLDDDLRDVLPGTSKQHDSTRVSSSALHFTPQQDTRSENPHKQVNVSWERAHPKISVPSQCEANISSGGVKDLAPTKGHVPTRPPPPKAGDFITSAIPTDTTTIQPSHKLTPDHIVIDMEQFYEKKPDNRPTIVHPVQPIVTFTESRRSILPKRFWEAIGYTYDSYTFGETSTGIRDLTLDREKTSWWSCFPSSKVAELENLDAAQRNAKFKEEMDPYLFNYLTLHKCCDYEYSKDGKYDVNMCIAHMQKLAKQYRSLIEKNDCDIKGVERARIQYTIGLAVADKSSNFLMNNSDMAAPKMKGFHFACRRVGLLLLMSAILMVLSMSILLTLYVNMVPDSSHLQTGNFRGSMTHTAAASVSPPR